MVLPPCRPTRRLRTTKWRWDEAGRLREESPAYRVCMLLQALEARLEALKQAGNTCFGQGKFEEAAAKYNEAIRECPAGHLEQLVAQPAEAVRSCDNALKLDATYVKARLRRAQANERVGSFAALKQAQEDYEQVEKESPQLAAACRAALLRLPDKMKAREQQEKDEMLGKLKDLGNSVLGKFGMSLDNFQMKPNNDGSGTYSLSFNK
ncbi:hypothetical protein SYNPS1DRAFT_13946 [Syncephalis pseudoplumigaleata]|uniref:Tetratricopeptide repeat protein 1 n=1 Tax=Syncephalis pseudoplumigaleata TaxID=1712513 RepID=A0A4V1J1X8_9FUNG|nr:hypothetical protein SYNPS1DRAFT_13946 [Syncephalis pseudoplumigaleata]|eukprot:RKP26609.1 hypothetical protein SYNPS1DRAFT_13946 [Syncephalis pseudoplumigaleata]